MMFLSSSWREVLDRSCADQGTRFLRLEFVVTGKQRELRGSQLVDTRRGTTTTLLLLFFSITGHLAPQRLTHPQSHAAAY